MRKTEFMLKDPFEVTGQWWVPEKADDKIYGTLRYLPTDIELELSGTLDDVTARELVAGSPEFKDHPCILGLTHDRQKFTLLRAHASSLGSTTKYGAFHVIADKHVPALSELKFRQVSFYCQHLDVFIARRLFTMENDGEKENFKSCTVKYHQPEKLKWRIDEIKATLDFQTGLNWISNAYEQWHKLHAKSFVTIKPDSPQDLDWFQRQIWRFCYFLTLVTDEVVSTTGIEVFLEDDKYPGWHLYQAAKERETDEKATPVFLFHLPHLFDQFESMLKKWFSVSDTMLDAIHLMMDAQRNHDHSTQGRFLLLAHAVEVFSRATTSSNYTFFERINGLLDSLSAKGREIVCKDPAKFARGIVDTRNYHTHYTDDLRPKALPPVATYWASEKLSFLMRIVLFKYLGIDEAVVVKQMSEHHRLLQRIFYSKEQPESMKVD
ncbi:MAG: HEPN domain-containing protein [Pirellulaceae bacterium]